MEEPLPLFDRDTRLTRISDTSWQGTLSPAWNIGDNPNGGYMVACALRALNDVLPHPHPLSVTTHFLRTGIAGEAFKIQIELIRTGRTLSTVRATLLQAAKARIEILAAYGDLDTGVGVGTTLTVPPPELPEPGTCPLRSGETQGIHLPILERLEVRLHPAQADAGNYPRAVVSGWIRHVDERDPDAPSLVVFADAFPPSPFAMLGVVGWVPTLELTVHVRAIPAPGWIRAEFSTRDLQGGRMIESGQLWDSNGVLVAQSRQLGLVMNQSN